jgi:hypothetical protein
VTIHHPLDVKIHRQGVMIVLEIVGTGSLNMPREGAHAIARRLMEKVAEIDAEYPERQALPKS